MKSWIHYLPLITTLFSLLFTWSMYRHWREKPDTKYLLWWTVGVFFFGVGTFTESITTLFGWKEWVFKSWYITGALHIRFPAHRQTSPKSAHTSSLFALITVNG